MKQAEKQAEARKVGTEAYHRFRRAVTLAGVVVAIGFSAIYLVASWPSLPSKGMLWSSKTKKEVVTGQKTIGKKSVVGKPGREILKIFNFDVFPGDYHEIVLPRGRSGYSIREKNGCVGVHIQTSNGPNKSVDCPGQKTATPESTGETVGLSSVERHPVSVAVIIWK